MANETSQNAILIKLISWLAGVSLSLFSVISWLMISKVDHLQATVDGIVPTVAQHTTSITQLSNDVRTVQGNLSRLLAVQPHLLYALKPDDVGEELKSRSNTP